MSKTYWVEGEPGLCFEIPLDEQIRRARRETEAALAHACHSNNKMVAESLQRALAWCDQAVDDLAAFACVSPEEGEPSDD